MFNAARKSTSNATMPLSGMRVKLCAAALAAAIWGGPVHAEAPAAAAVSPSEVDFDSSFLMGGGAGLDVSRFDKGNVVLPGEYSVDVVVKDGWSGHRNVTFKAPNANVNAEPCFDKSMLTLFGVDLARVQAEARKSGHAVPSPSDTLECGTIATYVPGASASFDAGEQRLDISVPQIYLLRNAKDSVDPSQWQHGIDAGLLNYDFSSYNSRVGGMRDDSAFVGLTAGVNVGGWRLRHQGNLQWSNRGGSQYVSGLAYAQHDLTRWKAQLTVGDTATEGSMFDAVPVRGASITSDPRMLPNRDNVFAPMVRGVADSNAQITVRQHGQVIYQTSVPAGPFELSDVNPISNGGDLDVSIKEADGRQHGFTVPYSVAPGMLTPGTQRFSLVAGTANLKNLHRPVPMFQATLQRGVSNRLTAYAGLTGASGYAAAVAGAALNTHLGAFNADVTMARLQLPGGPTEQGHSIRVAYSKGLNSLGTNLSLAAYRYASSGYNSLSDAVTLRGNWAHGTGSDTFQPAHERNELRVSLSQRIGERGSLFLQGSSTQYWHGDSQVTFSAGYGAQIRSVSYGVTLQRTRITRDTGAFGRLPGPPPVTAMPRHPMDTQIMFNVSMPLGSVGHAPILSTSYTRNSNGLANAQAQVTGTAGAARAINYGVAASQASGRGSRSNSLRAYAGYTGSKGMVMANASTGDGSTQFGLNASGGLVAHSGGITLSQSLGEAVAIVHAPGAAGAKVEQGSNVRVDRRGYAVVPYLTPYRNNTVNLDPSGMSLSAELKQTSQIVAPRAGSVVRLEYKTVTGRSAVISATQPNGAPLPFGAEVTDAHGQSVGAVGQGSQVLVRGVPDAGHLDVRWGSAPTDSCSLEYSIAPDSGDAYAQASGTCVAPKAVASQTNPAPVAQAD